MPKKKGRNHDIFLLCDKRAYCINQMCPLPWEPWEEDYTTGVHALVVLLVSRASPKHSLHPASCFPAQLLVCYFQLCNQALIWGICGLSSEMRPKCGPFPQFRILRVESNLGNKVMDGTLHLLRRHLNQHHDTPRSSMDCAYTLKL